MRPDEEVRELATTGARIRRMLTSNGILAISYWDRQGRSRFERGAIPLRAGWPEAEATWHLRVSVRTSRELEAGDRWPTFETRDRICSPYRWPQIFVCQHEVGTDGRRP
jgi:hypothetical protein